MKLNVRRSMERGHASHGWLDSYHTFSFADYHDTRHMGFRSLRVINQDRVAPNSGFPMHPHRDMEIFSYVVSGALAHQDSMGNRRVLEPGQVQLMSAGSGVTHSEFNPSPTDPSHFLQIWIHPRERGLSPGYTEWHPPADSDSALKVLMISPDGRDGSALIHQDASIWRVRLGKDQEVSHEVTEGRGVWLQVIRGTVAVGDVLLAPGDALSAEESGNLAMRAEEDAELLLFDLG